MTIFDLSICPYGLVATLGATAKTAAPRQRDAAKNELELHETAVRERGPLPSKGQAKAKLAKMHADGEALMAEAQKQAATLNAMQQKLMAAAQTGERPDQSVLGHMSQLHHAMNRNGRNAQMLQRLREDHFGPRMRLFALFTQCFTSKVIGEKRLKGGTPNVVPRLYQVGCIRGRHAMDHRRRIVQVLAFVGADCLYLPPPALLFISFPCPQLGCSSPFVHSSKSRRSS